MMSSQVFSSIFLMFFIIFLLGAFLSGNACLIEFIVNSSTTKSNGVIISIDRSISGSIVDSNSIPSLKLLNFLNFHLDHRYNF